MFKYRRDFLLALVAGTALPACTLPTRKPSAKKIRKNSRIAIVGGGPAGISMSHFLCEKGFKNIKLFENTNRLGGKSNSFYLNNKSYELGTVGGAESYYTINYLADHYNVPREIIPSNGVSSYINNLEGKPESLGFVQMMKTFAASIDYKKDIFNSPLERMFETKEGFDRVPDSLCVSFKDWIKKNNISPQGLTYFLDHTVTPYGYGYFDEVPAAYVLKYMDTRFYDSFFRHTAYKKKEIFIMTNGFQNFWETIAQSLNKKIESYTIKLNSKIKRIVRGSPKAPIRIIKEDDSIENFDYLILACPHQHTPKMIYDFSRKERDYLKKIKTYNYYTFAIDTDINWPTVGVLPVNYSRDREKHPIFWYRRWPSEPTTIFYAYANNINTAKEEVLKTIQADGKKYNWNLGQVHEMRQWEYFPHFGSEDLLSGVYDYFEDIQGYKNTFRIGELMSFATVERTSRYSNYIANSYF